MKNEIALKALNAIPVVDICRIYEIQKEMHIPVHYIVKDGKIVEVKKGA